MSQAILKSALLLAYGPFLLMALLYLVGFLLRLSGRPGFLATLVERTKVPAPVRREHQDSEP